MNKQTPRRTTDPIRKTIIRLASMGRSGVPVELIVRAWRSTLYPELEYCVGERNSVGLTEAELNQFEARMRQSFAGFTRQRPGPVSNDPSWPGRSISGSDHFHKSAAQ
jgi:hypothetical protein